MPKGFKWVSNLEKLTRKFFSFYAEPGTYEMNFRPDWLRWKTGYNLELDLFFPEWNLAIEANGSQHKIASQREKDDFKEKQCKTMGIYLLTIWKPRDLIRPETTKILEEKTGEDFSSKHLPYSFIQQLIQYKPKKLKKLSRVFDANLQIETYKYLQAKETESNRLRMEWRNKKYVTNQHLTYYPHGS